MLAVGLGRNRIARLLLERGPDVHARDGFGATSAATAVHIGAEFGNVEMIVALATAGGDVNAADDGGFTPVCIAAESGDGEGAGRARRVCQDGEERRRHASLHRGAEQIGRAHV